MLILGVLVLILGGLLQFFEQLVHSGKFGVKSQGVAVNFWWLAFNVWRFAVHS